MEKLFKAIARMLRLFIRERRDDSRPGVSPDPAFAALRKQLDVLQESEQSLRITLLSIGDGVIATDGKARITFLNPSAQELMGWTLEQALGRPFLEVFCIFNSLTGQPAENIVQTVLTTKRKVNLANHTVLVRPDGTRRHISDSAAPIYDAQGDVTGVVLVFSDVTERYELQRQLRISEARSSAAVTLAQLGTWEYDTHSGVTVWSPTYKQIVGVPPDYVPDTFSWKRIVCSDDLDDAMESRAWAVTYGSSRMHYRIRRQDDGALRYVRSYATIDRAEDGSVVRMMGVLQDITEEVEAGERIRQSEALYRSAFERSVTGMVHVGLDGRFLRVNRALCDILGYSAEELLTRGTEQVVHPEDAGLLQETLLRLIQDDIITLEAPRRFLRSDGEIVWLSLSSSVMRNSKGEPLYIISSAQDITARRQAEANLLQSERRLKRAQELSHTGNWEIDLVKRQMWASDEAFRIYGFAREPGNQLSLAVAQSVVVPEHRGRMDEVLERLLKYDASYDIEFSIHRFSDGSRREVHSIAVAERDESGRPLRVIGVLQDITERRRLQEEYGKALSTTLDGFWLCDKNVRIVLVNDAICSMLGYTREELVGMPVHKFEACLDTEGMRKRRESALASGADRFETRMRRKDGSMFDVEVSLSYIPSSESTCAFMRDITERKRKENHIRYLSYHDALTGLYNRAFFEEECARLDESRILPVTVVMGDINGLKLTNDVFGHTQGDKLLRAIAKILSDCARSEDIAFRTGGDEFCLLMPGAGPEAAKALCERIRLACERETVRFDDGSEMHPSVAVGYATRWTAERSFNEVFKEAEDAMYKRKLLERKSMHSTVISSIRVTMYEKSRETREHADRLTEMACGLGRKLGLDDAQLSELELLCALHDLGKIGIPERILDKPGPLTEEEWFEMRKHPEIGYRIAQASPELMGVAEGILCHHERWDGKGYPQGLQGNKIPLLARILSIADSFDAMTCDRMYHKAISREQACAEIEACAGSQFDPEIAALFVRTMRDAG